MNLDKKYAALIRGFTRDEIADVIRSSRTPEKARAHAATMKPRSCDFCGREILLSPSSFEIVDRENERGNLIAVGCSDCTVRATVAGAITGSPVEVERGAVHLQRLKDIANEHN